MTVLNIHLQEGFRDDSVALEMNGKMVYNRSNCTTMQLTGLADSFKIKLNKDLNNLKVIVKSRNLEKEIPINIKEEMYIGLSIVNDTIHYILSEKPFGYG